MITLFCDASFCRQTGAAGWGAWAKGDGWPRGVEFGDRFHMTVASAAEAEICAIANAISALRRQELIKNGERIMIQSDCERALHLIATCVSGVTISDHINGHKLSSKSKPASISPRERGAISIIRKFPGLYVRHVYGHKAHDGSRLSINRLCDSIARGHMRRAREAINAA